MDSCLATNIYDPLPEVKPDTLNLSLGRLISRSLSRDLLVYKANFNPILLSCDYIPLYAVGTFLTSDMSRLQWPRLLIETPGILSDLINTWCGSVFGRTVTLDEILFMIQSLIYIYIIAVSKDGRLFYSGISYHLIFTIIFVSVVEFLNLGTVKLQIIVDNDLYYSALH